MKKRMLIPGVILLIAAAVLIAAGTMSRSLFYGIMDAPYSVYGKYRTFMIWFYIAGAVCALLGVGCLIFEKRK